MSKKTFVAFGVASAIAFAALSISLPASAQMDRRGGYGPGMMGGSDGWGMGWGMGGFGGIGLLVVTLLVVGFAFLAVRRRNS